jgi:hypothetical protein
MVAPIYKRLDDQIPVLSEGNPPTPRRLSEGRPPFRRRNACFVEVFTNLRQVFV